MHSHFLKKFFKKTLHFSGCWMLLKKWNNKTIVINITSPYNFTSTHRGLSPLKCKKKNCLQKILGNFQIMSPHYNRGGGVGQKPCYAWLVYWFCNPEESWKTIWNRAVSQSNNHCQQKKLHECTHAKLDNFQLSDKCFIFKSWQER